MRVNKPFIFLKEPHSKVKTYKKEVGDKRMGIPRRAFLSGLAEVTAICSSARLSVWAAKPAQDARHSDNGPIQNSRSPARTTTVPDPYDGKKKVLAIGDVHTGYQHDSVSHAMATLERLGRESGIFITYLRTDTQLITKGPIYGTGKYAAPPEGKRATNAKNLDYFDAIFFYGLGEGTLTSDQKSDLLSFIREDGKGFVGAHSAIDAFYDWPEYGEMIGAYFDNHPWGVMDAPIIVEEPSFPGMSLFSPRAVTRDEIYVVTQSPYSRADVDVLARLDASAVDLNVPDLHRTDHDFPIAWVKKYGRGNVFYSTLGHLDSAWDDPRVQHMYFEAVKWALGLTSYMPRPHHLTSTTKNASHQLNNLNVVGNEA